MMDQHMRENGFSQKMTQIKRSAKASEFSFGWMHPYLKAGLFRIRRQAKDGSFTLTAISMKVNGRTIKQKAMAHIQVRMVLDMKVSFIWTNSTEKVSKSGQTVHATQETILKVKNMGKAALPGLTAALTKANSFTITSRARENIAGQMEEYMWVNGLTIRCTAMGPLHGQMDANTQESTNLIRKRVGVPSFGQICECTKVNGTTGSSMDSVPTLWVQT